MALFKKKKPDFVPSGVDTTANAAVTPDKALPYVQLGLKDDEYARIVEILGRRPSTSELAMYSVMWSEHCSYKSSRFHLKKLPTQAPTAPAAAWLAKVAAMMPAMIGQGLRKRAARMSASSCVLSPISARATIAVGTNSDSSIRIPTGAGRHGYDTYSLPAPGKVCVS